MGIGPAFSRSVCLPLSCSYPLQAAFRGGLAVCAALKFSSGQHPEKRHAPHGQGGGQFNPRPEPTSIAVGTALSLGFYCCPNGRASCSTNNGNLMRQTIASWPPTFSVIQNYDTIPYDGVNRLKSVTEGTLSRSYEYDAWGNRWVSANTGLFLNPFTPTASTNFDSLNRLIIQGSWYDGAGNQMAIGGFTSGYNGENLMTSSTIGGVATQYGYDGNNRRVTKTTGTAQTVYVYGAAGELAAEYAPVTDPDPPCRTCYLLNDHLGSTRAMLDEAQALVARYDYLPFGEQIPTGYDGRTALWGGRECLGRTNAGRADGEVHRQRTGCGDGAGLLWGAVPVERPGEVDLARLERQRRSRAVRETRQPSELESLPVCAQQSPRPCG